MTIKIDENPFVIFDLDDTIFHEIDYLKSAFREIANFILKKTNEDVYDVLLNVYREGNTPFQWIIDKYSDQVPECKLDFLLSMYRRHIPKITLAKETSNFIEELFRKKIKMGMITDGRSVTQRNKLKALGIEKLFSDIIISEEFGSEKPNARNYLFFKEKYAGYTFYYIGDNTSKDFIIPRQLGWKMVCLKDKGYNIHKQLFDASMSQVNLITSFNQILIS